MAYCSRCGAQNPDAAKFCNNCAFPLGPPSQAAAPGPQQPPQTPGPLPPQLQPGEKGTLFDYLSHYQGLQYHWVRRFVALVIDAIIVVIPAFIILSVLSWMIGGLWLFTGIGGVLLFLYSALLESATGATIGKGALGLKVVSMKGRLDFADALVRNVTKIYAILLLLEFIVTLFVPTTDAHQRYMDKLAKTTVIEKR